MNIQDLKKILEASDNKFEIFEDRSLLSQYDILQTQLISIVKDFLTDEEKAKLFGLEHFLNLSSNIKSKIIQSISDDKIKLKILTEYNIISGFQDYEILDIVNSLGDDGKLAILHMPDFIKENNINDAKLKKMIKSLSDENKQKVIYDKSFIEDELHLPEYQIIDIAVSIESEESKLEIMNLYDFNNALRASIIKTFSDESKKSIIKDNSYGFTKFDLQDLVASFSNDTLVDFINEEKVFLEENDISIHNITRRFDKNKQLDFVSKIDELNISTDEKRKVLVTLNPKTKDEVDTSNFPEEYLTAIQMKVFDTDCEFSLIGKIEIDFSKDFEIYRGLDEFIAVNPLNITEEDRLKLDKLMDICPNMSIVDNIVLGSSTVDEYKNAEKWIETVLEEINPNWTDIQKIAFIDNKVGKKISYTPDFDTEVCDADSARALWKIIDSGYGVCNGIAQVEKYILEKVGIQSMMVSGKKHSFLNILDVEVPNLEGEITKGDTILDPTWNLTAHRYGAYPNNFCKSYEEIRKNDIRASDGKDLGCHRNDEDLASATLSLEEPVLRDVFRSLGLTDRDGNFPIKALIDKSTAIANLNLPTQQAIEKQLLLLSKYYPEFAECQNSTMDILKNTLLNYENLNLDKCVVNRVYAKEDENQRPILYVYAESEELGKRFYIPNSDTKQFTIVPSEEFISRFECYEMDIEKQDGYRPWETKKEIENLEDLTKSSGTIAISEGDGR